MPSLAGQLLGVAVKSAAEGLVASPDREVASLQDVPEVANGQEDCQ